MTPLYFPFTAPHLWRSVHSASPFDWCRDPNDSSRIFLSVHAQTRPQMNQSRPHCIHQSKKDMRFLINCTNTTAIAARRLATWGGGNHIETCDGGDEADEWRRQSGEREEWEEQVKRLPLNGCREDREHGRKWGAAPLLVFCERRSGAC
jgi:hypothetical protein